MDYRRYTIDEIMTSPDLKLGFVKLYVELYPNKDKQSLLNGCNSCIVKAFYTYINDYQNKQVMIELQNECKYQLVKDNMQVTVHGSEPLTKFNITDKRVESIIKHNINAAGHFKRKDGLDILTFMKPTPKEPEINATKAAIELAEKNNIELSTIVGTGKNGTITKGDVEAML